MALKWLTSSAIGAAVVLAAGIGTPTLASAHYVPAPCDFITAGGDVKKDDGNRANFGAHGGCKNGEFWGHVNYVDHTNQFHMDSTRITGYLYDPSYPNARDICGFARINDQPEEVMFRVRLVDNGEPGRTDKFGLVIDNWNTAGERFYVVTTRELVNNGGGNVQLHKDNPSNTIGPAYTSLLEWQMCGDMANPGR